MEDNRSPLTCFAPTIAYLSGVPAPEKSEGFVMDELKNFVLSRTGKNTVDKMLIFNPDAIGEMYYEKYYDKIFKPLDEVTDLKVKFLTAFPPKTPVCFSTMFSGCSPEVHGIQHYEKPMLKVDTLFDVWQREGKKVALISKSGQSIPRIFAGRDIDYFITGGDEESVQIALGLIKESDYDIIEVYNQEFDDMLHATYPNSYFCRRAAKHYVSSYLKLIEAVKTYWKDCTSLVSFSPDHGAHRVGGIFLGNHGDNIPQDMNIVHFFSVFGGKNE